MPQEGPNPITQHLMGLVEGRQQTELAKLSIMGNIAATLLELRDALARIEAELVEQNERMRK